MLGHGDQSTPRRCAPLPESAHDWCTARQKMERDFYAQMLTDREQGHGPRNDTGRLLTEPEMRTLAYEKACRACARAMKSPQPT